MIPSSTAGKILYVYNTTSSFTAIDRDLLAERWTVHTWYVSQRTVNLTALAAAVRQSDLIFGWFASWHTFWPVMLARWMKKPSLLIIGGYDTANLPEIGYGHQRGGLKKWISRRTIRNASRLSTFSEYSRQEIRRNLHLPLEQIHLIYLGIPDPFAGQDHTLLQEPRAAVALTIGGVTCSNLLRKGLLPFVQAARLLPNVRFVLAGRWLDDSITELQRVAPENVVFTGWLPPEQFSDHLRRASAYVQPSQHEGFGLSVAEAMLGGCIPVITRVGALPEVVGETGVYIPSNRPKDIADSIRQALTLADPDHRREARARILTLFPLENRRRELYRLIEQLIP